MLTQPAHSAGWNLRRIPADHDGNVQPCPPPHRTCLRRQPPALLVLDSPASTRHADRTPPKDTPLQPPTPPTFPNVLSPTSSARALSRSAPASSSEVEAL